MNDKAMVADTLVGINGELVRYGEMISQTENPQLKQTLKQLEISARCLRKRFIKLRRTENTMFRQLWRHLQKSLM